MHTAEVHYTERLKAEWAMPETEDSGNKSTRLQVLSSGPVDKTRLIDNLVIIAPNGKASFLQAPQSLSTLLYCCRCHLRLILPVA